MLSIHDQGYRLCDGLTRRDWLHVGGLGLFGLALPSRWQARRAQAATSGLKRGAGKAKACIVLFLVGGPSQHDTWDPKPAAPEVVRGPFKPISTSLPGLSVGEMMPQTAKLVHLCSVLRAVSTNDLAHTSSGYYMLTGQPHQPPNLEMAKPGAPNDWPCLGAFVNRSRPRSNHLPAAITLPYRLESMNKYPWPGQTAGWLGQGADPWLITCDPSGPDFKGPSEPLRPEVPAPRFDDRWSLLQQVNRHLDRIEQGPGLARYDHLYQEAFGLLRSQKPQQAFDLSQEPAKLRQRYGMHRFGQSVLLARRLVEAGVALVQVNWPGIEGISQQEGLGSWDTHANHYKVAKSVLMPRLDQSYSALLEDLEVRGLLDETLVVWMGEFGRGQLNNAAGRDHWGQVFSMTLAGGGIRAGWVHGASDARGLQPKDGQVRPPELAATIFHCLGISETSDAFGRPVPAGRGSPIQQLL